MLSRDVVLISGRMFTGRDAVHSHLMKHEPPVDLNGGAGAGVAAGARAAAFHRERAEAAQLDAIAAGERVGDLVEDGGDDPLDVAVIEMRVPLRQLQDQLRLGHDAPLLLSIRRIHLCFQQRAKIRGPSTCRLAVRGNLLHRL